LPPAQRRLHKLQLQQLWVRRAADHVDAGVQQLADTHAEMLGRGSQRRVTDVHSSKSGSAGVSDSSA